MGDLTWTWAGFADTAVYFDLLPSRQPEPLDVTADETFDRWLLANDGRTLEEFAADGAARSPDQRPEP